MLPEDKFCNNQCQLHKTHEERLEKVETVLHGKDDKDGLLVRFGKMSESFGMVRLLTYAFVGTVLAAFMGAVIALVIRSPK